MATKFRGFRALGIVGFAALTVTLISACDGNGTAAANSNGNGSAVTSTVAAGGQRADSGTGSGHSSVTTTTAAAGVPAPAPAAAVAASVSSCLPANLSFALGDNSQIGQDQRAQVVDMTNRASSTRTMEGFPGVDVIGDTNSQPSYDWTLTHSSANGIAKVTLRPGATAHFDLVYLSGDLASGGGSKNVISVQRMVVTTPGQDNQSDDTVQGSLAWFQDVVLQDGATHPGTYVMPVASGS
ncbi:MAG TPA: DUF4232 domain-containing protein [Pseudonocardiaceae bacterium]|jgi:hypothetical protein|nr:DUF4232 domain-containing protein [Pseudonocardiaceae bacterium]